MNDGEWLLLVVMAVGIVGTVLLAVLMVAAALVALAWGLQRARKHEALAFWRKWWWL